MARLFTLLLFFAGSALAQSPSEVEKELWKLYKNQILTIRHFYKDEKLRYNSMGDAINAKEGWWSIHSTFQCKKIKVNAKEVRISGDRLMYYPHDPKAKLAVTGERVDISFPYTGEHKDLLRRIFVNRNEDVSAMVPEYMRQIVSDFYGIPFKDDHIGSAQLKIQPGPTEWKETPGLKPPVPVHAPDPSYPEVARQAKLQGVVVLYLIVDELGNPTRIRIQRSMGAGLDETAAETAKTWRFKPATKDGVPIKIAINVEMNFSLY